jgi:hypothetical protein
MRLKMVEDLAVHLDGFHGRVPERCDGTVSLMEKPGSCQSRLVYRHGTQANLEKGGSLGAGTLPYGCLFFLMLAAQIVTGHSRNTEGVHVHA